MIYLIGGAPRVGKTHLTKLICAQKQVHAVSTDALRYMLRHTIPENVSPDIFIHFKTNMLEMWDTNHQSTLEAQNRQSKGLWPYMRALIASYNEDGVDLLLEGVAVLPEFAHGLDVPYKSVFLGNTEANHVTNIRTHARDNAHDWMHVLPDRTIDRASQFFGVMSEYLRAESAKYVQPYAEIRDATYEADLDQAASILLSAN